jgi:hypothetical protein
VPPPQKWFAPPPKGIWHPANYIYFDLIVSYLIILTTKFVKLPILWSLISPCRPRKQILLNFFLGLSGRCHHAPAKASSSTPPDIYPPPPQKKIWKSVSAPPLLQTKSNTLIFSRFILLKQRDFKLCLMAYVFACHTNSYKSQYSSYYHYGWTSTITDNKVACLADILKRLRAIRKSARQANNKAMAKPIYKPLLFSKGSHYFSLNLAPKWQLLIVF